LNCSAIRVLIISSGRADTISTHKFVPDTVEIFVPESQVVEYRKNVSNPIVAVPDEIKGLGMLRNYIVQTVPEETVIMLDDDVIAIYNLEGVKARRLNDKEEVMKVLINCAILAMDANCTVFGFAQKDIRAYDGTDPFGLRGWVGCCVGVVGKSRRFRDDKYKVDIDFCLEALMRDRIIWIDTRYYFAQHRDNNTGGNAAYRTKEGYQNSIDTLVEKWGSCIKLNRQKSQIGITLKVQRRQPLDFG